MWVTFDFNKVLQIAENKSGSGHRRHRDQPFVRLWLQWKELSMVLKHGTLVALQKYGRISSSLWQQISIAISSLTYLKLLNNLIVFLLVSTLLKQEEIDVIFTIHFSPFKTTQTEVLMIMSPFTVSLWKDSCYIECNCECERVKLIWPCS